MEIKVKAPVVVLDRSTSNNSPDATTERISPRLRCSIASRFGTLPRMSATTREPVLKEQRTPSRQLRAYQRPTEPSALAYLVLSLALLVLTFCILSQIIKDDKPWMKHIRAQNASLTQPRESARD